MPEIRMLGPSDDVVLRNVAPGVFDNAIDPALVADFLRDGRHHVAVAVDQGQVVGFASGVHYVHPDKPAEMFINEVAVAPSHHRGGIGRAVVQALLQHATRLGCREAWVLTDRDNHAAMRLYASTGGDPGSRDHVMFTYYLKPKEQK